MLTKRLRQLEEDGLARATPYSRRPLRLEYELTDAGRELAGALAMLAQWGRRQGGTSTLDPTPPTDAPASHRSCGTTLETRLWCPTCDRPVDDPEADELYWL